MAKKFYTVEKEINGVIYTAQFNGVSAAFEALDNSYIDNSSNISLKKLSEYLFKNVIVQPKGVTCDDFDSTDDANEVIAFARDVMQGNLKPEDEEPKAKSKE